MKHVYAVVVVLALAGAVWFFFRGQASDVSQHVAAQAGIGETPKDSASKAMSARWPQRPEADAFFKADSLGAPVFRELAAKYEPILADFKAATDSIGAQLVMVSFGIENGKFKSPTERAGQAVIMAACKKLGIPYYDFGAQMDAAAARGDSITFMPKDGHLSRAGNAVVAAELAKIVAAYETKRSTVTFPASARPATFGDLKPGENGVTDMGNGLPYLLKTNSQGLRMDHDVTFPKTKQRILVAGSSLAYFPFVDNDKTATGLLQAKFPDKEILNSAIWAYGLPEELSMFREKTKYTEPDLVILQESGVDILHLFFTYRNWQDREKHVYAPTPAESTFYVARFGPPK